MKGELVKFVYQLRIDAEVSYLFISFRVKLSQVEVVEFSDPEISAYAYERTLAMEQRSKYIKGLGLTAREKQSLVGSFSNFFSLHALKTTQMTLNTRE